MPTMPSHGRIMTAMAPWIWSWLTMKPEDVFLSIAICYPRSRRIILFRCSCSIAKVTTQRQVRKFASILRVQERSSALNK